MICLIKSGTNKFSSIIDSFVNDPKHLTVRQKYLARKKAKIEKEEQEIEEKLNKLQ